MSLRYLTEFAERVISIDGDDSQFSSNYMRFVKNIFFRAQSHEDIIPIQTILREQVDDVVYTPKRVQITTDTLRRCVLARQLLTPDPNVVADILDYTLRIFVDMDAVLQQANIQNHKLWTQQVHPEEGLRKAALKDINFLETRFPQAIESTPKQSVFQLMDKITNILRTYEPDDIRSLLYVGRTLDVMFDLICDFDQRFAESMITWEDVRKIKQNPQDWRLITKQFPPIVQSDREPDLIRIQCGHPGTSDKNYVTIATSNRGKEYFCLHLAEDVDSGTKRDKRLNTTLLKNCIAYNFCNLAKHFIADWIGPKLENESQITNEIFEKYGWVQTLTDKPLAKDIYLTLEQYEQLKIDFPPYKKPTVEPAENIVPMDEYQEGISKPTRRSDYESDAEIEDENSSGFGILLAIGAVVGIVLFARK